MNRATRLPWAHAPKGYVGRAGSDCAGKRQLQVAYQARRVFRGTEPNEGQVRIDEFLPRLRGVRPSGDGWNAQCPGHDDTHNSLKVDVGSDERILVFCHANAGCNANNHAAILRPLGLTDRDLFNNPKAWHNGNHQRKLVSTYSYRDE